MKTKASKIGIPLGVILFLFVLAVGSALAAPHEITAWHGNQKGAVSITFDDGSAATQYTFAFPALEQRGMKGTFFLTSDWIGWSKWTLVAAAGHEIGSHSVSHPVLTNIAPSEAEYQMVASQEAINAHIAPQKCVTIAYPRGAVSDTVEASARKYFIGARTVKGELNDATTNLYRENSYDIAFYPFDQMIVITDQAAAEGKWVIPLFHSFDPAEYPYNAWTKEMFLTYLDYLKSQRTDMWVATFGSVTKYLRERGAATLAVASQSDNMIELNLTDTLDDAIFDQPLTIRSEVPANWTKVTMQQGATTMELTPVADQGSWVVFYDALPDKGAIKLTRAAMSLSPVANDDAYLASQGHELKVAASGLLQNDSGIDKSAMKALLVRGPAYAELQLAANGSFVYKPQSGFYGTDTFSYLANFGAYDSDVAVVTVTVMPGYLKEVVVEPKDVKGGNTTEGTVKFEQVVERDAVVSLTLNSAVASAPATVTVPAGKKEASFQITTTAVPISTPVTITATYADRIKSFRFNVKH